MYLSHRDIANLPLGRIICGRRGGGGGGPVGLGGDRSPFIDKEVGMIVAIVAIAVAAIISGVGAGWGGERNPLLLPLPHRPTEHRRRPIPC